MKHLYLVLLFLVGVTHVHSQDTWDPKYAQALTREFKGYLNQLPIEEVLRKSDSTLAIIQDSGVIQDECYYSMSIARILLGNFHTKEAIEYLGQALDLLQQPIEPWNYYSDVSYQQLIMLFNEMGYSRELIKIIELKLHRTKVPFNKALLEEGLMKSYASIMELEHSSTYFKKAVDRHKELNVPDTIRIANLYFKRASFYYYSLHDFKSALKDNEFALELLGQKFGSYHSYLLHYYGFHSRMLKDSGDPKGGLETLKKCLKAWERGEMVLHSGGECMLYERLGELLYYNNCIDTAQYYLEKALALRIYISGQESPYLLTILESLTELYTEQGEYEKASQAILTCERIFDLYQGQFKNLKSKVNVLRGHIELKEEDYETAAIFFHQGLILLCPGFQSESWGENPELKADILPHDYLQNLNYKAIALYKAYKAEPYKEEYLHWSWESYCKSIDVIDVIRSRLKTGNMRLWQIENFRYCVEGALTVGATLYSITEDKSILEKLMSINERQKAAQLYYEQKKQQQIVAMGLPEELLRLEQSLATRISVMEAKLEQLESGSDSILQARFKLAARTAYQQWDSLQLVFQTDYPKYYEVSYPDTVFRSEAFSKLLSSQEKVALSYFLGDSISFLIGYRNGQFVLDTLPKKSELLPHIQQYERSLSDYDYLTQHPNEAYQDFTQSAYQLHELLFPGKIKSLVQGASHLLIFPDGDLTNLPFEALLTQAPESHTAPDYSNLPYLLHDFNITYSPSALLLLHQSQKLSKAEQHYLGMAPDYDTDFLDLTNNDALLAEFRSEGAALSGNIKEVEAVAQLFRGDYYLNDQADEGRFKADASQYQILHMAMHGLVDKENPLSSRLIFGRTSENEDGMLHAYELYNMSLNADLAVLSACYSGAGKILPGEGSMNIARAFNYAGCPSVLMSLWQADDQAASGLVVDFFGNLRNGRDKSASLAQAKRNYINQAAGLKTHPFFWAGFVVIGDPSSLELSPTFGPLQIGLVVLLIAGLSLVYFLYRKNQRSSPISQRT